MPITLDGTTGITADAYNGIDQADLATALNVSGSAPLYACRAWVNFNGVGTVAIRASGNVTSITDEGVGAYTLNFATAMSDVNYAVSAGCKNSTNVDHNYYAVVNRNTAQTTTTVRITTIYFSNLTAFDNDHVYVAIFR